MRIRKTLRRLRSKRHSRKVHSRRTHKLRAHKLRGGFFGLSAADKAKKARKQEEALKYLAEEKARKIRMSNGFAGPSKAQQDFENAQQAAYYDEMREYERLNPDKAQPQAPWNM